MTRRRRPRVPAQWNRPLLTQKDGQSANTWWTLRRMGGVSRATARSLTAKRQQPSSEGRSSRTLGTPGLEPEAGARPPTGAARAPTREGQIEGRRLETEADVEGAILEIEVKGKTAGIDGTRIDPPVRRGDRAVKEIGHSDRRAAGGTNDRKGLTSKGPRSEQLTEEKQLLEIAGTFPEDQAAIEPYKLLLETGTGSPSATPDRVPRGAVMVGQ